jgi:hypothetical protein
LSSRTRGPTSEVRDSSYDSSTSISKCQRARSSPQRKGSISAPDFTNHRVGCQSQPVPTRPHSVLAQ